MGFIGKDDGAMGYPHRIKEPDMHANEGRTDRLYGPLQTETVLPTLYRQISLLNPGPEKPKTHLKQVSKKIQ